MRISIILLFVFFSCEPKTEEKSVSNPSLKFASTFSIEKNEKGTKLINTEPWPQATRSKAFIIDQPLKRVVCTSTSHLPYFEMLLAEETLVGFPNVDFISSANFLSRIENGSIQDLGSGQSLNLELLIGLKPDAVIGFDAGGDSKNLEKIEKLGIPVIYNSDFLEQTPLGRAEYVKFFGALLGKEKEADSIFNAIKDNYNQLKESIQKVEYRPKILSGTTYGDTWFLPGGQNWSAKFFHDAGGEYLWEDSDATGWLELSFEAVFEKAHAADYWIGVATYGSLEELKSLDNRYTTFQAFSEGNVFNYNKKKGPNGGIDFFESAYARPDLVLSDLISILHPSLLPNHEMIYYQRLP